MSEEDVFCRDCEKKIGPNILDTEKPCYHILITEFTEIKKLGHQTDSFMLCNNCLIIKLGNIYQKEMK